MGEKPSVNPQRLVNNASMSFVYCTPGVFSMICGFDELVAQGVIKYYYTYKMPGCEIVKSNTSSDRVAGFMIVGDSLQEVKQKIEYANSRLKVLDENGNDIMNHNLY
jgi:hypothetical protein